MLATSASADCIVAAARAVAPLAASRTSTLGSAVTSAKALATDEVARLNTLFAAVAATEARAAAAATLGRPTGWLAVAAVLLLLLLPPLDVASSSSLSSNAITAPCGSKRSNVAMSRLTKGLRFALMLMFRIVLPGNGGSSRTIKSCNPGKGPTVMHKPLHTSSMSICGDAHCRTLRNETREAEIKSRGREQEKGNKHVCELNQRICTARLCYRRKRRRNI